MNSTAHVVAELAGDLDLITRLSEVAVIRAARTVNVASIFVVLDGRGDRAGFEVDVIVRGVNGGVRTIAVIAVLVDAPADEVATVKRDLLTDRLDLPGAFAELSGDERRVGCAAKPFSWMEGLYRDAVRRRYERQRLIATLHAVARRVREQGAL